GGAVVPSHADHSGDLRERRVERDSAPASPHGRRVVVGGGPRSGTRSRSTGEVLGHPRCSAWRKGLKPLCAPWRPPYGARRVRTDRAETSTGRARRGTERRGGVRGRSGAVTRPGPVPAR